MNEDDKNHRSVMLKLMYKNDTYNIRFEIIDILTLKKL